MQIVEDVFIILFSLRNLSDEVSLRLASYCSDNFHCVHRQVKNGHTEQKNFSGALAEMFYYFYGSDWINHSDHSYSDRIGKCRSEFLVNECFCWRMGRDYPVDLRYFTIHQR